MKTMRPVVIESPFGTNPDGSRADPETVARNVRYLGAAMLDSLRRGEAPFASHGLYPAVLADAKPEERRLGMDAGFVWGRLVLRRVFYVDLGVTPGMREGLTQAQALRQVIEHRTIPGWSEKREPARSIEEDIADLGSGGGEEPLEARLARAEELADRLNRDLAETRAELERERGRT